MASSLARKLPTVIGAMLLAATLFTAYTATQVQASHEPANKAGASGSDLDTIPAEADPNGTVLLSDTLRVSSPEDAIISVSAECSILTSLTTGGQYGNSSEAFGAIRLWIEVDGIRVPVSTDDTLEDDDDVEKDAGDPSDIGEVTFCNRTYHRDVADTENDGDGTDVEDDYIRTRNANAFNWMAFDLGTIYDVDGDNVITVELLGDFDATTLGTATAQAFVGSRTMIIEPTKVSNHEAVAPDGTEESKK